MIIKKNSFYKILLIIRYFFIYQFKFRKPERKDIIIFDCAGGSFLEKVLFDKNFYTISTRKEKIKTIYLTTNIFIYLLSNFFKRSLKQNYLISLIREINPDVVITHIDNSPDFHVVSRELHQKICFMAVQRANRDFKWLPIEKTKKIYIPNYFCFSEHEEEICKNKKISINNFFVIGSLRASLSLEYIKEKKIKIDKNEFDICLVGEPQYRMDGDGSHLKYLPYSVGTHAEFTHRFCKKYDLKLVFAGSSLKNSNTYDLEYNFYKEYLSDYNFQYLPVDPYKFSSYLRALKSKVVIGCSSTLLREALTFDKKIFCCNFTGHTDDINEFFVSEDFILREDSYDLFEKKLLKILSIKNEEYLKSYNYKKNYLMPSSVNAIKTIRNQINKQLSE